MEGTLNHVRVLQVIEEPRQTIFFASIVGDIPLSCAILGECTNKAYAVGT